jgi:thymidylate synthase (FAD)
MEVQLIDYMGDDLTVVNAARVSMDKESDWRQNKHLNWVIKEEDKKLIKYLAKHKHWTPFAHPQITLRVTAPVFVRVQCFKHKVGFTENEISRRYVSSEPTFHRPREWRKRATSIKQGSSDEIIDALPNLNKTVREAYNDLLLHSLNLYNELLDEGVCPEQARMVLPQSMETEWYWTGSLASFARFVKQRTHETSQRETSIIARKCAALIQPLYPEAWRALMHEDNEE